MTTLHTTQEERAPRRPLRTVRWWGLGDQAAPITATLISLLGISYIVSFTLWTIVVSFSASEMVPEYSFVGLGNYVAVLKSARWQVAYANLFTYSICFVGISTIIGLLLAILIDQRIRGENLLRTIYLYPMAISFVVTGAIWGWILNPTIGIEQMLLNLGFEGLQFRWATNRNLAIYAVVMAAVWQSAGFATVLFLAGLRSIDPDLTKAAHIDGAGPIRLYARVLIPTVWPVFIAVLVILLQFAIKTYDLVVSLTAGGPGISTTLPTLVIYDLIFQRGLLGQGAAAAVMLLLSLTAVLVPYLVYMRRRGRRERQATGG